MLHQERQYRSTDGTTIYYQTWTPGNEPKGVVCLQHGLAEHSGRYQHVAEFFVKSGYAFFASDLRGHGKSAGKRGHTPSLRQFLDDAEELLKEARKEYFDAPLIFYGHSTGGTIVANYLINRNVTEVRAAILSAPWLKLAFEPPKFKVALAKIASKVFPSFTQDNELNPYHLSRDKKIVAAYQNDPLVHRMISAKLFLDCYRSGISAIEKAGIITIPTLIMHGTNDLITSKQGSEAFHQNNSSNTQLKIYEGFYHELHNEPGKENVLEDMVIFLEEVLNQ